MRGIGEVLGVLGMILIGVSYIWSFIIGYRKSVGWLIGLLVIWVFFYPPLVFVNWERTKNNFFVFLIGVVITVISFFMLVATNPNKMA